MKCKINNEMVEMEYTRDEFENDSNELLERLKKPILRSLRDSKLTIEDIDKVVMVGGSTKLPVVRAFVAKLMKKLPDYSVNPDEVVAVGACMQAAMKERNEVVEDIM